MGHPPKHAPIYDVVWSEHSSLKHCSLCWYLAGFESYKASIGLSSKLQPPLAIRIVAYSVLLCRLVLALHFVRKFGLELMLFPQIFTRLSTGTSDEPSPVAHCDRNCRCSLTRSCSQDQPLRRLRREQNTLRL